MEVLKFVKNNTDFILVVLTFMKKSDFKWGQLEVAKKVAIIHGKCTVLKSEKQGSNDAWGVLTLAKKCVFVLRRVFDTVVE